MWENADTGTSSKRAHNRLRHASSMDFDQPKGLSLASGSPVKGTPLASMRENVNDSVHSEESESEEDGEDDEAIRNQLKAVQLGLAD